MRTIANTHYGSVDLANRVTGAVPGAVPGRGRMSIVGLPERFYSILPRRIGASADPAISMRGR